MATKPEEKEKKPAKEFDPAPFIEVLEGGYARCTNPTAYESLQSITVRTHFTKDKGEAFRRTIQSMVDERTLSPRFSQIILHAAGLGENQTPPEE